MKFSLLRIVTAFNRLQNVLIRSFFAMKFCVLRNVTALNRIPNKVKPSERSFSIILRHEVLCSANRDSV